MIERRFQKGDASSVALYSPCEAYRYALTRVWDGDGRRVLYVMLNPSTATEVQNDPTIERCERRARRLGYGAMRVVNIFAYRATDPRVLKAQAAPVGPDNAAVLRAGLDWADTVIAAWGAHGGHLGQGAAVTRLLRAAGCRPVQFGLSRDGHPRHPLYVAYATLPEPWAEEAMARLAGAPDGP